MLADFYITGFSTDLKIAVQKTYLGGQFLDPYIRAPRTIRKLRPKKTGKYIFDDFLRFVIRNNFILN